MSAVGSTNGVELTKEKRQVFDLLLFFICQWIFFLKQWYNYNLFSRNLKNKYINIYGSRIFIIDFYHEREWLYNDFAMSNNSLNVYTIIKKKMKYIFYVKIDIYAWCNRLTKLSIQLIFDLIWHFRSSILSHRGSNNRWCRAEDFSSNDCRRRVIFSLVH